MTKIIQRHDTAANWTSVNPVLASGEMGVETDTNKFKFGDGVTAWTDLAYATESVDAYTKAETDSLLNAKQDKLTAIEPLYIEERILGVLTQDWYLNSDKIETPTYVKSKGKENNSDNYYPYGEQILESDKDINVSFTYTTSNASYSGARFYFEWATNRGYILIDMSNSYSGRTIPISIVGIDNSGTSHSICSFSEVEHGVLKRLTFNWSNTTKQWYFKIENMDTGIIKTEQSGTADYSLTSNIKTKPRIYSNASNTGTGLVTTTLYTNTLELSSSNDKSLVIGSNYTPLPATASSLGVVQPDGTSITISDTGVISGQDVKTFTGYSDTGTLVLKSINGVLQWVAET